MIYIDASRYSNTGKRTGVENYSFYLINELVGKYGNKIHLITPRKIDLPATQTVIPFPRLWTHIRLSWHVLTKKIPNLFVPSHVLPLISPKKSAITLHDVAFKRFPESYSRFSRWYLNWSTHRAVKKAAIIFVPSKATQDDLIHFYKADPQKIHITPLGISQKQSADGGETSEILKRWNLMSKKYFLYVGRLEHKKNTDTLLRAFAGFAEKNTDMQLVLAGFQGVGGEQVAKLAQTLPRDRLVITGYISDEEKEALMANALCFIFPSRYEGFGLPLLEAMQAKVPIISSDIPSSREILGNGAWFFETESAEDLESRIEEAVTDRQKAKPWVQGYEEKLEKYTWEKCAERTMEILKNLVE